MNIMPAVKAIGGTLLKFTVIGAKQTAIQQMTETNRSDMKVVQKDFGKVKKAYVDPKVDKMKNITFRKKND